MKNMFEATILLYIGLGAGSLLITFARYAVLYKKLLRQAGAKGK